ncbi:MAG: hypothetical protein U0797_06830 [Gemmataceae bacterium]
MPRVFRKSYTREIPENAQPTTATNKKGREVPAVRFKGTDGKWVVAPLTKEGGRCLVYSPTWYGKVNGLPLPLCENKAASEIMLGDFRRGAANRKAGIGVSDDPFEEHRKRPSLITLRTSERT